MTQTYQESINSALGEPQDPIESKYGQAIDSVLSPKPAVAIPPNSPDSQQAIKELQLRRTLNAPQQFVTDNYADLEKKTKEKEREERLKGVSDYAPAIGRVLQDPDLAPAVVDYAEYEADIENSERGYFDNIISSFKQSKEEGITTRDMGLIGWKALMKKELTPTEVNRLNEINNAAPPVDYGLNYFEGIPGEVASMIPSWYEATKESAKIGVAAGLTAAGAVAVGTLGRGPALQVGSKVGRTAFAVNMPIEFGMYEAGAAYLEYTKYTDENGNLIDDDTARGAALAVGFANGGLEAIGFKKIAGQIPGIEKLFKSLGRDQIRELMKDGSKRALFSKIGKNFIGAAATEGVTEFAQEVTKDTFGGVAKAIATEKQGGEFRAFDTAGEGEDYQPDYLGYLAQNLDNYLEAGIKGSQGGGGFSAANSAMSITADAIGRNQLHKREKKHISEAIDRVQNSELHQQDPELWKEVHEESLGNQSVYINAENLQKFMQLDESGEFAEFLDDNPEINEQMEEALELGGDLVLPKNKVYSSLAKESNAELRDALQEYISLTPEARNDEQTYDTILNEVAKQVEQEAFQDDGPNEFAQQLEERVTNEAAAAGYSPQTASIYAKVFKSFYESNLDKLKGDQEGINILQSEVENMSIKDGLPDETDALIQQYRTQKAPSNKEARGSSLIEELRKRGVNDEGGELKARDADVDLKPFQRKMANDEGMTLDEAAGWAKENGYIAESNPDLLLEAIDSELSGSPVFAPQNENQQLADTQRRFEAIDEMLAKEGIDADSISDFNLKRLLTDNQSKVFTQSDYTREQTQAGVSFDQDLSKADKDTKKVFNELVAKRKAMKKLIDCI